MGLTKSTRVLSGLLYILCARITFVDLVEVLIRVLEK